MRTLLSFFRPSPQLPYQLLTPGFTRILAAGLLLAASWPCFAVLPATQTTLVMTSGGSVVDTVTSGTVVTLTATVLSGTTMISPGQVRFCDASAAFCTDIHLLATAQLTKTGTAVFKFRPGSGSRSYKAVFLGTKSYASSSSSATPLTVTVAATTANPTITDISYVGNPGSWDLTARVLSGVSTADTAAPTGTVSFLDQSNGDATIATAALEGGPLGLSFVAENTPVVLQKGEFPTSVAVADYNGDGIPDVVAVVQSPYLRTYGACDPTSPQRLVTLLGNGDGTFKASSVTIGNLCKRNVPGTSMAVGDFNGDGIPDLALTFDDRGSVLVLLGNGDGTFTGAPAVSIPCGCGNFQVAVDDFNGDGNADLVVTGNAGGTGYTSIFPGNGDGTFAASLNFRAPEGQPILRVLKGDFNGDGISDIGLVLLGDSLQILLGNRDGTINSLAPVPISTVATNVVTAGDFNGDGVADLAVGNGSNVTILLGKGDGTFTESWVGGQPGGSLLARGDFNGDGIPDLAVFDGVQVWTLLGNGDGTFAETTGQAVAALCCEAAGDFNGDGLTDLFAGSVLLAQWGWTATATGQSHLALDGRWVQASYPGDGNYNPSLSAAIQFPEKAALSYPSPGMVLWYSPGFFWTSGVGVTSYEFTLGTTGPGSSDLYKGNPISSNMAQVNGIPLNRETIYARLSSLINGAWYFTDYTYTMLLPSVFNSPPPGTQLSGSTADFSWTPGVGVPYYWLTIADVWSGSTLYDSGSVKSTSIHVTGLPMNGAPLQVTFRYEVASAGWFENFYNYTEFGTLLTTPTPGTQLSGSTVDFSWNAETGASSYRLIIGDKGIGSTDLYDSGVITTRSSHVTGLPLNGAPINVTLYFRVNGAWLHTNYTYTEFGTPSQGVLTTPAPGTQLGGSTLDFSWTAGTGASSYRLIIGDICIGSTDLYDSGFITSTSAHVSLPPNGAPLYVTLYSKVNGIWRHTNYTYTEFGTPSQGVLTTPTPGTQLSGSTVDFSWTPGTGASSYRLIIGSTWIGSTDIYDSGVITTTSTHVTSLPLNGAPINVTLYSKVNGVWLHTNHPYTEFGTPSRGVLTSPTPGTQLSGSTVDFSWTPGTGASSYRLIIGDITIGSTDLYDSGFITTTSAHVTGLPLNGAQLFVTLYSKVNGVWLHTNYTYKAQFRGMVRNGSAPVAVNGGKAGEICRMELLKPGVVGSILRSPTTLSSSAFDPRGVILANPKACG